MRKILVLSCVLLFPGCVSTPNFSQSQSLAPNEGLLLTTCSRNEFADILNVYESGYDVGKTFKNAFLDSAAIIPCSKNKDELSVFALEEGDYFIGSVGVAAFIPQERAVNFHITANKVNYIGDLRTRTTSNSYRLGTAKTIGIYVKNNFAETKQNFLQNMPELAQKYSVISAFAKIPAESK